MSGSESACEIEHTSISSIVLILARRVSGTCTGLMTYPPESVGGGRRGATLPSRPVRGERRGAGGREEEAVAEAEVDAVLLG